MAATQLDISFSHFGMWVTDIRKMVKFYTGLFGFVPTDKGKLDTPTGRHDFVFLSRNPKEHHQIVLASGRPKELAFNTINQLSFRVDSFGTLRRMHQRLAKEPVSDIHPVCHGNALSVYFRDPEGNRIELFLDTPWYVRQPMRIPMDITLSDRQIWKWAKDQAAPLESFKPVERWRADMKKKIKESTARVAARIGVPSKGARRPARAAVRRAAPAAAR